MIREVRRDRFPIDIYSRQLDRGLAYAPLSSGWALRDKRSFFWAASVGALYARRRVRAALRIRKYLSTNLPSRPTSGPPQAPQTISRESVSGPASILTI